MLQALFAASGAAMRVGEARRRAGDARQRARSAMYMLLMAHAYVSSVLLRFYALCHAIAAKMPLYRGFFSSPPLPC